MKKILMLAVLLCLPFTLAAQHQAPSSRDQIGAAVLAAPEEARAAAAVLGYDAAGALVTLREGTNEYVCLADDPARDGFSAACYHRSLEPFMARGRRLRAEGKSGEEIRSIRGKEVQEGTLPLPLQPTTLYVLSGKEGRYNPSDGTVEGAALRYVVYVPYATAASTGLATKPTAPGQPWLMDAGTFRAHIMIIPPSP